MRSLLTVLVALVVIAVLALGYFGFVPGVAGIFGSDKPRDLGVKATAADLQSANSKTGVELVTLPASDSPKESLKYSGEKPLKDEFTSAELTALVNNGKWKYYPVSDCQIKVGADGTLEASGLLRLDRVDGYAAATGIPAGAVKEVMERMKLVPNSAPPFYIRGTGSVDNGSVTMNPQALEVGRLPVPSDWITDYRGAAEDFVEDRIRQVPGLSIRSATFSDGKLVFDGTVPETEATSHQ